jgi:hypothetical protein
VSATPLRCMCGDTECPSCGSAQGTYPPPELEGWCARCRDHATLERDPDDSDAEWLTPCCGAKLMPTDVEEDR